MIAIKAPKLGRLQSEVAKAPALYKTAMIRALSTTKRDTKADATKIAQEIYTAGRNKISASISTSKIDRTQLSFKLIGLARGLSLVDFKHSATKKAGVRVQVLRNSASAQIPRSFKKRGSKTGKMRIMQRQPKGSPIPVIALASSSVADMLNRPAVRDRLELFAGSKMSNELARQIALVFR